MPISKYVFQSWKTRDLPPELMQHRDRMIAKNPDYQYELYTDAEMDQFVNQNYSGTIANCYNSLNIMVARVDFWRYLVLYKFGGIYLDMDSEISLPLNTLIRENDRAIITKEGNPYFFVQWCMMFEAGHPILKSVIDVIVDNIQNNRYPNDVHKMTGPTAFTEGIQRFHRGVFDGATLSNDAIRDRDETYSVPNTDISYRIYGVDYNGYCAFKHPFCQYLRGAADWREEQKTRTVLTPGSSFFY